MHIESFTVIKTGFFLVGGGLYSVEIKQIKGESSSTPEYLILISGIGRIIFTCDDVKSGKLRQNCINIIPAIDKLNDQDYEVFVAKFCKEFDEK